MNTLDAINGFFKEYRYLSNFYAAPFTFCDNNFKNSEQAFQYMKVALGYQNDDWRRDILNAPTAEISKVLGRRCPLRPDWDTVKDQIMHDIVFSKFSQNPELRDKLISTGSAYLEETNSWNDKYWGVCGGIGQNKLGKTLMTVRNELAEKYY
jgi:ribA/ribD-fused uncharacterized protein